MKPSPTAAVSIRSSLHMGLVPRVRTGEWVMIGQDGGQSIPLGSEGNLFVFCDTMLLSKTRVGDHPRAPYSTPLREPGVFLANNAAISTSDGLRQSFADLRYFLGNLGFPRLILKPTREESEQGIRFWPEHGIYLKGRVYLYYLGIQVTDQTSVWGYRNRGTGLACLDPRTGEAQRILDKKGDWRLWPCRGDDFHFGVQVLRRGSHAYVFGSLRRGFENRALLARAPIESIDDRDAYRFLTSTKPTWHPSLERARDLGPSGSDYSVSYNGYLGRFLMCYVDSFRKTLSIRTARRLWGPYSAPREIAGLPHSPRSELLYLAFEHPRFAKNNGQTIYLSYCEPHFSPNSIIALRFE